MQLKTWSDLLHHWVRILGSPPFSALCRVAAFYNIVFVTYYCLLLSFLICVTVTFIYMLYTTRRSLPRIPAGSASAELYLDQNKVDRNGHLCITDLITNLSRPS